MPAQSIGLSACPVSRYSASAICSVAIHYIADRLERQLISAEDKFGLNPPEQQRIFAARAAGSNIGDLFGRAKPTALQKMVLYQRNH
ncbi:MAG: hypothetical protein JSC189_000733 [Candidatus Tokpelaia sp. JSC189]|nr:MAG: hypothetical protein JSC189_000733 [Candidatus Tokpelaia sp. JSC189]